MILTIGTVHSDNKEVDSKKKEKQVATVQRREYSVEGNNEKAGNIWSLLAFTGNTALNIARVQ